jgi:hypothetical protein
VDRTGLLVVDAGVAVAVELVQVTSRLLSVAVYALTGTETRLSLRKPDQIGRAMTRLSGLASCEQTAWM